MESIMTEDNTRSEINRKEIEDIKTQMAVLNTTLESIDKNMTKFETVMYRISDYQDKIIQLEYSYKLVDQKLDAIKQDSVTVRGDREQYNRELKQQLKEMDANLNTKLSERLETVYNEIKEHRKEFRKSIDDTVIYIDKKYEDTKHEIDVIENDIAEIKARLSTLENWKWWIMGLGAAAATIFTLAWRSFFG